MYITRSEFHGRRGVLPCFVLLSAAMCASCNGPAVVDRPAADLDLKIAIIDTDESPSDGKVPVVAQFFLSGDHVELGGSSSVNCNGVPLPFTALGHAERVNLQSVGGTYTFAYAQGGTTTSLDVTVPPRPVITSPAAGSTVTRVSSLTITYTPGGGTHVRGSAGDGATGISKNAQPDSGSYTGFDVTGLNAGPGTIGLTRLLESSPSGTGFDSVEVDYTTGAHIGVTWD